MSSEKKGEQTCIEDIQPKAEYTSCRNHVLNLANTRACKYPQFSDS